MSLPAESEIVIVGGGAIGLGVAYSLARAGKSDILLVERAPHVGQITTSQGAGLCGQVRGSVARVRLAMHSVATFRELQREAEARGAAPLAGHGLCQRGARFLLVESLLAARPSEYVRSLSPDRFTERPWQWAARAVRPGCLRDLSTPWQVDARGYAARLVTPRVLTPRSRGKHPSTE